ncbi:MAG: hypothetical protein JWM27_299 [Gemmatimonadetes bacterium]|nr:hypothetical protein [Gemmatimonadota bacterium]
MADNTLILEKWPNEALQVHQSGEQAISFRGEVPVCIRVCEPICARSDYGIELNIFGNPVASITVSGTTRIAACAPEAR